MNKNNQKADVAETTGIGHNQPPEDMKIETLAVAGDVPRQVEGDTNKARAEIEPLLATANRAPDTIENDDVYERMTTLLTLLNKAESDREKARKKHKDAYTKAGNAVDAAFNLPVDGDGPNLRKQLEEQIARVKQKMSDYDTKKLRAEEERAEAERAALAEAAAKDGITLDTTHKVNLGGHRSEHGGTSIRNIVYEWEITDEAKLPRTLLSPDPKKIQEMIDNGATDIPGLKIERVVRTHATRSGINR